MSDSASLLADAADAVVYLWIWTLRDNLWTRAGRFRSGERIKVRLFSWDDYSSHYEKFNRREEASLQVQDPVWRNGWSRSGNNLVRTLTLAAGKPFALVVERYDSA